MRLLMIAGIPRFIDIALIIVILGCDLWLAVGTCILIYRGHRAGRSYTARAALTDLSFVLGVLCIGLYVLHTDGFIVLHGVGLILTLLWPFLFWWFFSNLKHWSLHKDNTSGGSKDVASSNKTSS